MKFQLCVAVVLLQLLCFSTAQRLPYGAFAWWTFDNPNPLVDRIGSRTLNLVNNPTVGSGAITFNGVNQYAYANDTFSNLRDKTLEAWVRLANLDVCCPGIAGIQAPDGSLFDSIVYNEASSRRWLPGSDFWKRTIRPSSPTVETEAASRFVHIAVTYNNLNVQLYREGVKLEDYTMPNPPYVVNGMNWFTMGLRHLGGGSTFLNGAVDEVRFYNRPLSGSEILANWCSKASQTVTKTINVEMIVGTTLNTMQIVNRAGVGSISMYTVSTNPSAASATIAPATGAVGTTRTLAYTAGPNPANVLVMVYHNDSNANCVTQTFNIKVFPAATTRTAATCAAGNGRVVNDKCFITFRTQSITWTAANDACKLLGGNLAAIRTDAENAAVRSQVPDGAPYWIGLHDRYTEGTYVWTDNTAVSYRNWRAGEPNNDKGTEDCVEVYDAIGGWNDQNCDYTGNSYYVCQFAMAK